MDAPFHAPTSFVPRSTVGSSSTNSRQTHIDFYGVLVFFAYGALFVVIFASIGVFGYERFLEGRIATQQTLLNKANKTVDTGMAQDFIHLRDQLNSVHILLNEHMTPSRLLNTIDATTVRTVSFNSLSIKKQDTKNFVLTATGLAHDFDALAAEANALTADGAITKAVFSGISVNKDNSVNFKLNAVVSPKLVANFGAVVAQEGVYPDNSITSTITQSSTSTISAPVIPQKP